MNWKGVAIILLVILVLENLLFGGLMYLGFKEIDNDRICEVQICGTGYQNNTVDSYLWDSNTKICTCYKNGDVVITKGIKDWFDSK